MVVGYWLLVESREQSAAMACGRAAMDGYLLGWHWFDHPRTDHLLKPTRLRVSQRLPMCETTALINTETRRILQEVQLNEVLPLETLKHVRQELIRSAFVASFDGSFARWLGLIYSITKSLSRIEDEV